MDEWRCAFEVRIPLTLQLTAITVREDQEEKAEHDRRNQRLLANLLATPPALQAFVDLHLAEIRVQLARFLAELLSVPAGEEDLLLRLVPLAPDDAQAYRQSDDLIQMFDGFTGCFATIWGIPTIVENPPHQTSLQGRPYRKITRWVS